MARKTEMRPTHALSKSISIGLLFLSVVLVVLISSGALRPIL